MSARAEEVFDFPAPIAYPSVASLFWVVGFVDKPALGLSLRDVAFHEAGHAVLMHRFRLRQNGAEAIEGRGIVHVDKPPPAAADVEVCPNELQVAALRIASMYMAGTVSQMLQDGLALEGAMLSDDSDWRNAERALDYAKVPGSATGRIYYCQRFAWAVLSRHWPAVVAVATALEQRGTLTALEIATLCEGGELKYHA